MPSFLGKDLDHRLSTYTAEGKCYCQEDERKNKVMSHDIKLPHLNPLVSRPKNTNIVILAILIPRQVLGPDPKGMKLYGFGTSCRHDDMYTLLDVHSLM